MNIVDYDAVVIGAGINGSCAALHLAKKGKKTALLEQFPLPNDRSSSAGQTRIFRSAHSSFDSYTPIIEDSLKQWKQLEKETNTSLLRREKIIFLSESSVSGEYDLLCESLIKNDSKPIKKSIQQFNQQYQTTFGSHFLHMEDNQAGILMAAKSLQCIQNLFMKYGGKILDEHPVTEISVMENGFVIVKNSKNNLVAKSLVICGGPWTNSLFKSIGIQLPIKSIKVPVFYWPMLEETGKKSFSFVCILNGGNQQSYHIFGLSDIEYPGLIKICYHGGDECDPNKRDLKNSEKIKNTISQFVGRNFPWLGTTPAIEEHCMYTMSPDKEMIIDQHPIYKNIAFATGFSGTGFKTGPTVGKILSELVTDSFSSSFDMKDFGMKRFKKINAKL